MARRDVIAFAVLGFLLMAVGGWLWEAIGL
jgi:hypothetical protein